MSKYCPVCFSEFKDSLSMCPTDKVELVKEKPQTVGQMIDIYAASDEIEAERIITFLAQAKIFAQKNVSGLSQFPVANELRYIICVNQKDIKASKALIEGAISDQVISSNGNFL